MHCYNMQYLTQNKLSDMRKTRTEVQTRRDIANSIEERVDKFNTKGR